MSQDLNEKKIIIINKKLQLLLKYIGYLSNAMNWVNVLYNYLIDPTTKLKQDMTV